MKGLLRKDIYMIVKTCRSYLFMIVIFLAVSLFNVENSFFLIYPVLVCGMLPMTLLSYDERSGWQRYSGTLPYSRAQLVSVKYIIGLVAPLIMILIVAILQSVRAAVTGSNSGDVAVLVVMLLLMAPLAPAFTLPMVFKFGVEKGRVANYILIIIIISLGLGGSALFGNSLHEEISLSAGLILSILSSLAIYAASWFLSVKFYEAREL